MNTEHRVIALDVGDRRIGVAIANLEARIASPLFTIDRNDSVDVFARIKEIITEHEAEAVIVGLPRGLEGQETLQTISTRKFARELEHACIVTVYLQDEAATSILAKEELELKKKPYKKGDVDKLAAMYILRDWLQTVEVTKR